MRSVARLFYTSGEYGDALGWAATAAEDTRRHYGSWPLEALESKTLLSVIEERLLEEEGSYVIINHQRPVYDSNEREPAAGDFVELL
ncbi:hypothetical protein AGDE_13539 [Angomonas deanei]|nr:hypothetical protein AGDE_13539 [Angomonas deanei]|eukprot:EPY22200.1 hypothetical protein AGDE_13539 [Angomonas deanei]